VTNPPAPANRARLSPFSAPASAITATPIRDAELGAVVLLAMLAALGSGLSMLWR